jgi:hypothetical protein
MPITARDRIEFGGQGSTGARVSHGHGAMRGCSSSPPSRVKDLILKDTEVWGAKGKVSLTH